jgi:hypothetical protein
MSNVIWGSGQGNYYPQTPFLNEQTGMPTPPWTQYFLNLVNFKSAPYASSGNATLPNSPAGFINVTVEGKPFKVAYYNN